MTTKINNLIQKICTKIKQTSRLSKTDRSCRCIDNKTACITETKSPISTSNILQQLEQIQASMQKSGDELSLT